MTATGGLRILGESTGAKMVTLELLKEILVVFVKMHSTLFYDI